VKTDQFLHEPDKLPNISKTEAKEILHRAKDMFRTQNEAKLVQIRNAERVYFAGDIHGDFVVMQSVVKRFLESPNSHIVFLGDIVDRAPPDCPFGSVHSMLLALVLKLQFPKRVLLLRGNHEGDFLIRCPPYDLDAEVEGRFGDLSVHEDFIEVFKLLPIMAQTSNGIFCTHGGIPKMNDWKERDRYDFELNAHVTWGDSLDYGIERGFGRKFNFNREELVEFLESVGASALLRGHDYNTLGSSFYNNKGLTVFTSRKYQKYGNGGVLMASARSNKKIKDARDITVEQLIDDKWIGYVLKELERG